MTKNKLWQRLRRAQKNCVRFVKKHVPGIKLILIASVAMIAGALIFAVAVMGWYMHTYDTPEYERFGQWPLPIKKEIPLWERKVSVDGQSLKIGMITDTQVHPNRVYRWGSTLNRYLKKKYTDVFENYKAEMERFEPDFTIHLGDIIEGTGDPLVVGEIGLRLVKEGLEIPGVPMYWVIGNHDLRSVARRQFQEALEIDYVNHVIDEGPYRFIIFDANYRKTGVPQNPVAGDYIPGFVSKENLAWLEQQLKTDKHVYIFMHQSLVPPDQIRKGTIANAPAVRKLLGTYHVEAVFDGHVERRYFGTFDGVDYYAFPGTKKSPRYPGAYYTMTIDGVTPTIMMFFTDPLTGEITEQPFVKDDMMVRSAQEYSKDARCEADAECEYDELCIENLCRDIDGHDEDGLLLIDDEDDEEDPFAEAAEEEVESDSAALRESVE